MQSKVMSSNDKTAECHQLNKCPIGQVRTSRWIPRTTSVRERLVGIRDAPYWARQ